MNRYITLLIAGITLLSCSKQLDEVNTYQEGREVTYTAYQEYDSTKTILNGDGIYWNPKDEINMFFGSTSSKFISQNTTNSRTASFSGYLPVIIGSDEGMPSTSTVMGLYPYDNDATCVDGYITTTLSKTQEATANTFAKGAFPTIARTIITNYSLSFYNVCGGLKFEVKKSGIKKVVVSSNSGEYIAGKFKTHFGSNGYPETEIVNGEGENKIEMTSSAGLLTDGTSYYIVMLPTALSNGITIRLETDTEYTEVAFTGNREIKRRTWGNLGKVDDGVLWEKIEKPESEDKPLTFTSSGYTSISLRKQGSPDDIALEYRKGLGNWYTYTIGTEIELNDGESVVFQATADGNSTFSKKYNHKYYFSISGKGTIAASGNIMSLLDKTLIRKAVTDYCFYGLFENCKNLTQAPELPATTLADLCYSWMFSRCESLMQAPELPATTLANCCYSCMFYGCKSLTQAPELPATTLAFSCYESLTRLRSRNKHLSPVLFLFIKTLLKKILSVKLFDVPLSYVARMINKQLWH